MARPKIAVLVPCYNEAATITKVVSDFAAALPDADIHVFDNASTDDTLALARHAGAQVSSVALQGKGQVVRRQFADVDADVLVLVDGDDTYAPESAARLVEGVLAGHDMVVGIRDHQDEDAYRSGHVWGNRLFTGFLGWLFGRSCRDVFSGYRAFSRRFAKSFPAHSSGFEIETELTVHALQMRMPVSEIVTAYGARPSGSKSKLNTWRDGLRILRAMLGLFGSERPIQCYGWIAFVLAALSVVLAVPLIATYLDTGLVPRLPTAVLSAAIMILAVLALLVGVLLDAVTRARMEIRRMAYLQQPAPRSHADA